MDSAHISKEGSRMLRRRPEPDASTVPATGCCLLAGRPASLLLRARLRAYLPAGLLASLPAVATR